MLLSAVILGIISWWYGVYGAVCEALLWHLSTSLTDSRDRRQSEPHTRERQSSFCPAGLLVMWPNGQQAFGWWKSSISNGRWSHTDAEQQQKHLMDCTH